MVILIVCLCLCRLEGEGRLSSEIERIGNRPQLLLRRPGGAGGCLWATVTGELHDRPQILGVVERGR